MCFSSQDEKNLFTSALDALNKVQYMIIVLRPGLGPSTLVLVLKYNFVVLVLILKSYISFMDVLVLVLKYYINVLEYLMYLQVLEGY